MCSYWLLIGRYSYLRVDSTHDALQGDSIGFVYNSEKQCLHVNTKQLLMVLASTMTSFRIAQHILSSQSLTLQLTKIHSMVYRNPLWIVSSSIMIRMYLTPSNIRSADLTAQQ